MTRILIIVLFIISLLAGMGCYLQDDFITLLDLVGNRSLQSTRIE